MAGVWAARHAKEREEMEPIVKSGMTMNEIAAVRGVSRQAVEQKLAKLGLLGLYRGLAAAKGAERKSERDEAAEIRCQRLYGCDRATWDEMIAERVGYVFCQQRKNARYRGIEWELSQVQWWRIWKESGKWGQRGRLKGQYCMSRFGDVGPYAAGNVAIIQVSDNAREARSHAKPSKATGVYKTLPGSARPWAAHAKQKILGYFATEGEAIAARVCALSRDEV